MNALTDSELIDALGGTTAVARLCEVRAPSVSEWRVRGIPKARRMFLSAIRPDIVPCREGANEPDAEVQARAA